MSDRYADMLQALYDSEINFRISTFWDGGFTWELGDESNGFKQDGSTMTFPEAVERLCLAAHHHFQDSVFHLGSEEFNRRRLNAKATKLKRGNREGRHEP